MSRASWSPRNVVAFAGLSLSVLFLYSKGYSPQFVIYPLAFVLLLLGNLRGIAYLLLLSIVNMIEWPITFGLLGHEKGIFALIFSLRTAIIAALGVEYAVQIFAPLRSAIARTPLTGIVFRLSGRRRRRRQAAGNDRLSENENTTKRSATLSASSSTASRREGAAM